MQALKSNVIVNLLEPPDQSEISAELLELAEFHLFRIHMWGRATSS